MNRSLSLKINTVIVVVFLLCCSVFVFLDYRNKSVALQEQLEEEVEFTAHRLQYSLQTPLWEFNNKVIEEIVLAEMKGANVSAVIVRDLLNNNSVICGKARDENWKLVNTDSPHFSLGSEFSKTVGITYGNQEIGGVSISLTDHFAHQKLLSNLKSFIIKMVFLCVIETLILILSIQQTIISRINRLKEEFLEIEGGNLDKQINIESGDELGSLSRGFDKLRRGIKSKISELNHEIEERKQAEEALYQSEIYLRTLIHSIPDLVWLKSEDGTYLFCNSKFECFFGAREADIIGKTDYDFVEKELADYFREHDKRAMAKGGPSRNEEEVTFADDGHKEILETVKTPIYLADKQLVGVLGIARDITERKKAEEEKRKLKSQLFQASKMEAIGTLSGGIAHDFNNILAAILGYAEMALLDIPESNPAQKKLRQVLKAGNRAKEMVKHILAFSRKEAVEKSPEDIYLILVEALKLLRASIPATIEMKQNLDTGCGNILADSTQIHQVVMNLCTNAAQSMDEQGGRLDVELVPAFLTREDLVGEDHLASGHYICLIIKDTGPGIPPEIIDKIFDPYFSTKAVGKGSGMGLAVVLGIVKSHDGFLTVDSRLGRGTTFKVYFPRIEEKVHDEMVDSEPLPMGSETVLVVDDEEDMVEITRMRLEQLGYRVLAKKSSLEAFELFRSQPDTIDLVLTDQTMPELTGAELAGKLKEIRSDIPIIICSGYSSKMDKEKADLKGLSAFLMKPAEKGELARTIRQVLDKKNEVS